MKRTTHGFTLIELVIVFGVIVIIVSMSFGVFVSVINRKQGVVRIGELLYQSNYAFERISTAARHAVQDQTGSCLGLENQGAVYLLTRCNAQHICRGLKFVNAQENNACQEFFLDHADGEQTLVLKESKNGVAASLLSGSGYIKNLRFIVNGDSQAKAAFPGELQPRATIMLRIGANDTRNHEDITIQTTISAR